MKNSFMTSSEKKSCHRIIHTASLATGGVGAGLAQLPGTDNAAIVPIQLAMIIALGRVFDMDITKSSAEATLATAAATVVGRGISQALVGWIPGVGNVINATTAATITEGIGWMIANNFADAKYKKLYGETIKDEKTNKEG